MILIGMVRISNYLLLFLKSNFLEVLMYESELMAVRIGEGRA